MPVKKDAAAPADADVEAAPAAPELDPGQTIAYERQSATRPIIAADGHVVLSQADIDARDS